MARVTYLPDTDLGLVHRSRGKRLVNGYASINLPGAVLSHAPASDFLVTVKKTKVCTYVPSVNHPGSRGWPWPARDLPLPRRKPP